MSSIRGMDRPEVRANLPRLRQQEMARAREILGVSQRFLGFTDSGLPEGDPLPPLPGCFALTPLEDAVGPLVRAVREFRPHVMLAYDESGGYPHPDHIMSHRVAVEAFEAAADPDRYPGTCEPWQPLKLYYFASFQRSRFMALHEEMLRRGLESPYVEMFGRWQERADRRAELEVTTRVPCGDFFGLRDEALQAHATQIDPKGFGSPARSRCSAPRGRPRTIIWLGRLSIPSCRKMICSPGSARGCACDGRCRCRAGQHGAGQDGVARIGAGQRIGVGQ